MAAHAREHVAGLQRRSRGVRRAAAWSSTVCSPGITPAVPERSLPNSVLYESEDALAAALPALAAAYEEAGHPGLDGVGARAPRARTRRAGRRGPRPGRHAHRDDRRTSTTWSDRGPTIRSPTPTPSLGDLGRINDLAYGTGDAFQRILGDGPARSAVQLHRARYDGRAVASVVSQDHGGDCSIWWVATVPEARGRGLAAGLMRRALADGRARGCEVSTLQATKLGRPGLRAARLPRASGRSRCGSGGARPALDAASRARRT